MKIITAKTKFIKAFTLVEVLITLGIIGVVAMMVIPTLNSTIQDMILKSRWKKEFANLNQAFLQVQVNDGESVINDYFTCTTNYCTKPLVLEIISQYKFSQQNSALSNTAYVSATNYKSITGADFVTNMIHQGYDMNDTTLYYWCYTPGGASIWVDVNGYRKPPNILGRDLFAVELRNNKMAPFGTSETFYNVNGTINSQLSGNWCSGVGSYTGSGIGDVQSVGLPPYAGIGCSYEYLK